MLKPPLNYQISLHELDCNFSCTENFCRLKGTGEYNKFYEEGDYKCAGCGTPLYKSSTKFDSGCGWPAFFEGFPGAINRYVRGF